MGINNIKISVIIPTLNAEAEIVKLIDALKKQSVAIDELIIIDSESNDRTVDICQRDSFVKTIKIKREEFDHGKTRDAALRESIGDFVVFLTQDAIPANGFFIEKLIAPFTNNEVAACTGRQLPKQDASQMEIAIRSYNYPAESHLRTKADISSMGIKAFFFSDVCAAYRRDAYMKVGGFEYPLLTNEDMFIAAKMINSGYTIAYVADATVYHSHNFTLKEQYQRNYLQGYEIARHAELLSNVSQDAEGFNLVKNVSIELMKHGHIISLAHFGVDCFVRLIGNKNGKKAYRSKKY